MEINDQIKLHVSKQSGKEMKRERDARKYILVVGIETKEFTWHFEEQGVRKKYKIKIGLRWEIQWNGRVGDKREKSGVYIYFIL